ncbi:hypothetical protein [Herbiconiux daphne]|uniref:Uncharacterized protein n=1 Tax=Herbiconiux daphne TaxID=2970914 RepID=A0ABT2HBB5_9MICO|nr:hypothetical protein [Herbiconiux daphne]MCS5737241.1 hypothetical protein [Herbiconiux daphne]
MIKNQSFSRKKLPKLTAKQQRAIRKEPTDLDIIHDAKELYSLFTDILLGALIEPDRDKEAWVRRQLRDTLAMNNVRRVRTLQTIWNAQHSESAFAFVRHHWQQMDSAKADDENGFRLDNKIIMINFNETVMKNV